MSVPNFSVMPIFSEAPRKHTEGRRGWHAVWLQQAFSWNARLKLPPNRHCLFYITMFWMSSSVCRVQWHRAQCCSRDGASCTREITAGPIPEELVEILWLKLQRRQDLWFGNTEELWEPNRLLSPGGDAFLDGNCPCVLLICPNCKVAELRLKVKLLLHWKK